MSSSLMVYIAMATEKPVSTRISETRFLHYHHTSSFYHLHVTGFGSSCVNTSDKMQDSLLPVWHCAFAKTFKRALAPMPFIIFTYCLVKAEKGNFNFKNEFSRTETPSIFLFIYVGWYQTYWKYGLQILLHNW